MSYLSNWKFWLFLIIITVFILWIFLGGEEHEFIGLRALDPNAKSGGDPTLYPSPLPRRRAEIADNDNELITSDDLEMGTCPTTPFEFFSGAKHDKSKNKAKENYDTDLKENQKFSSIRTPLISSSIHNSGISSFAPDNYEVKIPIIKPSPYRDIVRHIPPRTPLSTTKISNMKVNVSLESALAESKNERKNPAESRGETICRHILQDIYGMDFPTVRPDFLKNPETGYNLELDGYCDELQIGFEYNGIQHYIFPNFAHRTEKDFEKQIRRDQYKIEACDLSGVYLISIPYNIPHNMIKDYIIYYLPENLQKRIERRERGEDVPENPPTPNSGNSGIIIV